MKGEELFYRNILKDSISITAFKPVNKPLQIHIVNVVKNARWPLLQYNCFSLDSSRSFKAKVDYSSNFHKCNNTEKCFF